MREAMREDGRGPGDAVSLRNLARGHALPAHITKKGTP